MNTLVVLMWTVVAVAGVGAYDDSSSECPTTPEPEPDVPTTEKPPCKEKLDVAFLLDTSGMGGQGDNVNDIIQPKLLRMKEFIANMFRSFHISQDAIRVSALTFGGATRIGFKLNQIDNVNEAIAVLGNWAPIKIPPPRGYFRLTHVGLQSARSTLFQAMHGDRAEVANVAMVITDGRSKWAHQTAREAPLLRDSGVEVFVVGVGVGSVDAAELEIIASSPYDDHVFRVADFDHLNQVMGNLSEKLNACRIEGCGEGRFGPPDCDEVCHCADNGHCDTTTGSCEGGCADGWRSEGTANTCQIVVPPTEPTTESTTVPTTKSTTEQTTKPTTVPPTVPTTMPTTELTTEKHVCEVKLDVAFIIDTSTSVGNANYVIMKDFIANVFRRFHISQDTIRVSALTFGGGARIGFKLNEIHNVNEAIAALGNLAPIKTPTLTHEGLRAARTVLFQPNNGDRVKAPNVAIVITDGKSTYASHTIREAAALRGWGVEVFVVGVGSVDPAELKIIASSPYDDHVFRVADFDHLSLVLGKLSENACTLKGGDVFEPCYHEGVKGSYTGTVSVTKSGLACQRWDIHSTQGHKRKPEDFPEDGGKFPSNHCRMLGSQATQPWCYTVVGNPRWEHCTVPVCTTRLVFCESTG